MLKVYYTYLPDTEPTVPEELLSSYKKNQLKSRTNARVRRQSVYGELLLRYALRDCGIPTGDPPDILFGKYGKPALRNSACFFSLSHSGSAVLCALGDRDLGADIQLRAERKEPLLRRCFTPDEQLAVRSSADPDGTFCEIWTKKESRCKLDGRGLALPLGSFSVFDDSLAPLFWHDTAGDYHMAVCSETVRGERPELIEVKTSVLLP